MSKRSKPGNRMAEAVNPSLEESYWRQDFSTRPYLKAGTEYENHRPAYRCGWEARGRYGELNWEGVEPQLRAQWSHDRGASRPTWDEASAAARDAWERIRPGIDYRAENR